MSQPRKGKAYAVGDPAARVAGRKGAAASPWARSSMTGTKAAKQRYEEWRKDAGSKINSLPA